MLYIQKTNQGLLIDDGYRVKTMNKGLKQYLNEMLIFEHSTYQGRLTALRKKYQLKNNVPIYIHEECCFYMTKPIREHDALCINYFNVLSLRQTASNHTEVIFKNLKILKLSIPYSTMIKKHLQARQLIDQIK